MSIYTYIQEKEAGMRTGIPLEDGWYWNMKDHIKRSFLYKHSQFERNNEDRENRPFKNIVRPILNIHYRTEGFDVRDIELYVDNSDTYYKSFLIKKFHEKWALRNEMDTFIDELVENYVDYGGVLVKNVRGVRPEVVDLRTLAFCDQTDILSGPFAIKHYFSPTQLRRMVKHGWDEDMIELLILKAENRKWQDKEDSEAETPGKYIELYEVHNVTEMDYNIRSYDGKNMMYVCGFYSDENGNPEGITVFNKEVPDLNKLFKFLKRDPIQGRALGFGAVEELFEPQVWTNFAEIQIADMLSHAAKTLYLTTDKRFKDQVLTNKKSGSVLDINQGHEFAQLDNTPRNLTAFSNYVVEMHEHATEMGAASDLFLGHQPTSGTPFKSLETQLVEGKSLHLWRQGRIAVFVDEIYREWSIPHIAKEITKGTKFLSELSTDEMLYIGDSVARNYANKKVKEALFKGELVDREQYEEMKMISKETFIQGGNKRFLEILKDEMSGEKLGVATNIAGKQKNLHLFTDKLVNYVRQLLATPEARQDEGLIKHINEILEFSGLSPISYGPRLAPVQPEGTASSEGLKELAKADE